MEDRKADADDDDDDNDDDDDEPTREAPTLATKDFVADLRLCVSMCSPQCKPDVTTATFANFLPEGFHLL